MLTNTQEYQDLKDRIASFLRIDSKFIYSIVNPTRRKKVPYLLVCIERAKSVFLKKEGNSFKRIQ